jgi:hypothetical protein
VDTRAMRQGADEKLPILKMVTKCGLETVELRHPASLQVVYFFGSAAAGAPEVGVGAAGLAPTPLAWMARTRSA